MPHEQKQLWFFTGHAVKGALASPQQKRACPMKAKREEKVMGHGVLASLVVSPLDTVAVP